MIISELDAVDAARRFAGLHGEVHWDSASIQVSPDVVEGRHAWVVKATDAPASDQPAWTQVSWKPTLYFVDANSGRVFGFANERVRNFFK